MQFYMGMRAVTLLLLLLVASHSVSAQQAEQKEKLRTISLYTGQGVDHNLSNLPGSIVSGNIDWDQTYFVGLSYAKSIGQYKDIFPSLDDNAIGSIIQGYEVMVLKHHGLQDNYELGVAYTMKSPFWTLGAIGLQGGFGIGLSHAFSTPSYEDGPFDNPDERYKTQLLLLFDIRMHLKSHPQWSLFALLHHRSGAYGVIAPENVGSNFLSAGFSYDF